MTHCVSCQDIILHSQEVTGFQVKELLIQQLQTLKPETFQQQRHILDMVKYIGNDIVHSITFEVM
jgi:hypothetical protein